MHCCVRSRTVTVRDLLAWVEFICHTTNDSSGVEMTSTSLVTQRLDLSSAYVHGACIVFVDAIISSGLLGSLHHYVVHDLLQMLTSVWQLSVCLLTVSVCGHCLFSSGKQIHLVNSSARSLSYDSNSAK